MGNFNLDDYAPVEERIALFYGEHKDGRILTEMVEHHPPLVVFRAEVYRDAEDQRPWATGFAYEKEGEGHVNRTSYVENCETSAIGRALANAGYHGKRDGAPRPSREEMQKVQRMGSAPEKHAPEAHDDGDMIACPRCSGPMWDNRTGKKSPKAPDLKCKDKDGCDFAIWLPTWEKDLLRDIASLHEIGTLDTEQRIAAEEMVKSRVPAKMLKVQKRLHELLAETPA